MTLVALCVFKKCSFSHLAVLGFLGDNCGRFRSQKHMSTSKTKTDSAEGPSQDHYHVCLSAQSNLSPEFYAESATLMGKTSSTKCILF